LNSEVNTDLIPNADWHRQEGGEAREQPEVAEQMLRLRGMKITRFWFKNHDKELYLAVKRYKNGCRCPECGRHFVCAGGCFFCGNGWRSPGVGGVPMRDGLLMSGNAMPLWEERVSPIRRV
jgi:hypothetical protein